VNNLVSNAIKYSPRGGVVHVAVDLQQATALVSVADQGLGVALEDQQQIFERSCAAPATTPGRGARAWACSSPAASSRRTGVGSCCAVQPLRGSTFTFTLPRPLPASASAS
jgi:signal transduction histidine kinase